MGVSRIGLLLCLLAESLHLREAAGDGWRVKYKESAVTGTEGQEVELPCEAWLPSQQRHLRVLWIRDDPDIRSDNIVYSSNPGEVAERYRGRTSLSNSGCALKIKTVAVLDATSYFFRFESETQQVTGTGGVQLRVQCADRWTSRQVRYGPSVRVKEGDWALLPCAFCSPWSSSYQSVQGYWLINDAYGEKITGNIVYNSARSDSSIDGYKGRIALVGSLSSGSCSLEIRDVTREDSKKYYFRVSHDGSRFSGKSGIQVTVHKRPFTSNTEGSKRIVVKVGTRATLNCTTTSSQPANRFTWWKHKSAGDYERLSETRGHLTLEAVALRDMGRYECEAWRWRERIEQSWTELQVFSVPARVALTPAQPDLRASVPATLVCRVDAVFPWRSVTVRWVLDNVQWETSTDERESADGTFTVTSSLSFTPSAEDHGKNCRCEVTGRHLDPTLIQDFTLDVKYKPVMLDASQDKACGGGDDVCLLCEVTANPRANITWTNLVESEESEWSETQGGDGTLTRSSVVVKRSQERNVTCVAQNNVGETEAVLHIKGLETASSASLHVAAGAGSALLLLLLVSALCWRGGVLAAIKNRNEAGPAVPLQLGNRSGPHGGATGAHERVQEPPRERGSAGDGAPSLAVSSQPLYGNVRREPGLGPRSQPQLRVGLPGSLAVTSTANNADSLYSLVGMAAQAEEPQPGALYSVVNRKQATPGPTCEEATIYSTVRPTGGALATPSCVAAEGGAASGGGGEEAEEQREALVYASLDFGVASLPH